MFSGATCGDNLKCTGRNQTCKSEKCGCVDAFEWNVEKKMCNGGIIAEISMMGIFTIVVLSFLFQWINQERHTVSVQLITTCDPPPKLIMQRKNLYIFLFFVTIWMSKKNFDSLLILGKKWMTMTLKKIC